MISGARQWILAAFVFAILAGGASRLQRIVRANSSVAVAERLRESLDRVRGELDACLARRDRSEIRFQALTRETRRSRQELDSIEAMDPRGVPAEVYEAYIERVEDYNNTSIPEWERQADGLRELALQCDSLAWDHNQRVNSLRDFLVEEGIWEDEWLRLEAGSNESD